MSRREVAMLRFVGFGLALMMSVPASAEKPSVPVTVEGSVAVDGSGTIQEAGVIQTMFNGKTPPHGFQICLGPANSNDIFLFFSDVGLLSGTTISYIELTPNTCYTTPLGYRPPGPVTIFGTVTGIEFAARMW
jgi:hypothetical protein